MSSSEAGGSNSAFCPSCGARWEEADKFCGACGASRASAPVERSQAQQSRVARELEQAITEGIKQSVEAPHRELKMSTKRIVWIVVAVLVIGLGALYIYHSGTQASLASSVKQSMQQTFDTSPDYKEYHLQVQDVTLVHKSGNEYTGIATVVYHSQPHQVLIDVTSAGGNIIWHTEFGQMGFLAFSQ